MKVIVTTVGSLGDLLPFMVVGEALHQRGHEVVFATNRGYETFVRQSGFGFLPIWDDRHLQKSLDDTILSDPGKAWTIIERDLFQNASEPAYDAIKQISRTGKIVVLSAWTLGGAIRAHRELGIPLCRVFLSPQAATLAAEKMDGSVSRELAFFPEWFGARQPEWPANLTYVGFPFYSDAVVPALPPALEAFLGVGAPPVIFTPGSFMRQSRDFFEAGLQACAQLGLRAVLLTPYADQVPALPDFARHYPYIALQRLAPRAAAIVHHGGIGTAAQALRAGIPQVLTPLFFDQFDNARHIEGLGVGQRLETRDDHVMTEALATVLEPKVRTACKTLRANFAHDPIPGICTEIENSAP